MDNICLIFVVFVLFFPVCNGEIFTAAVHLESLLTVENSLATNIDEYIESEMAKIDRLRQIATRFKASHEQFIKSKPRKLTENPLNRFRQLKTLTIDWGYAESIMKSKLLAKGFLGNVSGVPSEEDLEGVSIALFRLQDVYRLTATDMANGKIQGSPLLQKMTAEDCFELGKQAYNTEDYYHCILWMEQAQSRLRQEKQPTVEESDILDYLSFALYQQGNLQKAWRMAKDLVRAIPKDERARKNLDFYEQEMEKQGFKKKDKPPPFLLNPRPSAYDNAERDRYESLCRGESSMSVEENSRLFCYYKRDRPFLKLAGIKVEIVHHKPMAAIFRQVLSDYEISVIKQLAIPKLNRATVFNRATGKLEHADYRITKSAWLKSKDHPVIAQINQRLEDMTNLDQEAAEDFQVANYGIGGHYNPHFDHAASGEEDPYEDGQGNRISTVLFYMNTPLAGGATVFLPVKTTVFPAERDALFWYNLRQSGEPDVRTRHAACPVLAGQKWVSNKWIHERKQEFRRRCGLSFDSEDDRIADRW